MVSMRDGAITEELKTYFSMVKVLKRNDCGE